MNTSNSQMFKVSSNSHSSNTTPRSTTFTSILPSSSSTNSRPLILKSISKTSNFSTSNPLKLGNPNGFSPIKPKSDIFLPKEENPKIIKLTNGQQYKYLNTKDLLSNLKTTNLRQSNTAQQFQAKPPTLTLINVKANTSGLSIIDNNEEQNESRKRKRKQDFSSLKPTNKNTNLAQSQQEKNILEKCDALRHEDILATRKREDLKLAHNKFNNHLNRSTSQFKVSASLFKFKKSSNAVNENTHDDDEVEGEYDDDDDFLDDGISDEEDEEDGMVSKSLKENEFNGFGEDDDDDDVYTKSISSASCFSQGI